MNDSDKIEIVTIALKDLAAVTQAYADEVMMESTRNLALNQVRTLSTLVGILEG